MRERVLKKGLDNKGPVIYWMSRDQRAVDNWALIFAQKKAIELKKSLLVVFCMVPGFVPTLRQYDFMLKGLKETAENLKKKDIDFSLVVGEPKNQLTTFFKKQKPSLLVIDFDSLAIKKKWVKEVLKKIDITVYEVDAHNIVPCFAVSEKSEYGAYTLRPKINKCLDEYLTEFDQIKKHPYKMKTTAVNWSVLSKLQVDKTVKEVTWLKPGQRHAKAVLKNFIEKKLNFYDKSNKPEENALSNLSAYLHFGQISSQRIALEVKKAKVKRECKEKFLEELIVRKELADNFCYYNKHYDSFKGFNKWAQSTLNKHKKDKREYVYSLKSFEEAKTHDALWNAAQMEMVLMGKMHSYLRMYWAKKILQWTKTPERAMEIAIYLNDKYELDGKDPNGYAGIAWSIGGIHDRPWVERKVFGKIRYMSYEGCKNKFDVQSYIDKISKLQEKG